MAEPLQPDKSWDKGERAKEEGMTPRPSPKRNLLLIFLVVILAIVLISAGALAVAVKLGFASPLLNGLLGEQASEEEIKEPAFMYAVPEIVVNLPEGGRRFLSVKFYLGYDEPKLEGELEKRMPEIRDVVNKILWSRTAGEVGTPEGKEKLRDELLEAINAMLHSGELRGLYFWHVLVQ